MYRMTPQRACARFVERYRFGRRTRAGNIRPGGTGSDRRPRRRSDALHDLARRDAGGVDRPPRPRSSSARRAGPSTDPAAPRPRALHARGRGGRPTKPSRPSVNPTSDKPCSKSDCAPVRFVDGRRPGRRGTHPVAAVGTGADQFVGLVASDGRSTVSDVGGAVTSTGLPRSDHSTVPFSGSFSRIGTGFPVARTCNRGSPRPDAAPAGARRRSSCRCSSVGDGRSECRNGQASSRPEARRRRRRAQSRSRYPAGSGGGASRRASGGAIRTPAVELGARRGTRRCPSRRPQAKPHAGRRGWARQVRQSCPALASQATARPAVELGAHRGTRRYPSRRPQAKRDACRRRWAPPSHAAPPRSHRPQARPVPYRQALAPPGPAAASRDPSPASEAECLPLRSGPVRTGSHAPRPGPASEAECLPSRSGPAKSGGLAPQPALATKAERLLSRSGLARSGSRNLQPATEAERLPSRSGPARTGGHTPRPAPRPRPDASRRAPAPPPRLPPTRPIPTRPSLWLTPGVGSCGNVLNVTPYHIARAGGRSTPARAIGKP